MSQKKRVLKHRKQRNRSFPCSVKILLSLVISGIFVLCLLVFGGDDLKVIKWINQLTNSEKYTFNSTSNKEATQNSQEKGKQPFDVSSYFDDSKILSSNSDISKKISKDLTNSYFSGTMLVLKNGKVILNQGFGFSDRIKQIENRLESSYYIGSVQKMITAIMLMKLVDEEKVSLDDTLDKYYPEVPNSSKITLDSLLSMTSGLRLDKQINDAKTDEDVLKFAVQNVTYSPKEKWFYSAVNFTLLAGVIEKTTQRSYSEYFSEVFKNITLKKTGFYDQIPRDGGLSHSYENRMNSQPIEIKKNTLVAELGTGNLFMSCTDLLTVMEAVIHNQLLSKEVTQKMWDNSTNKVKSRYKGGVYQFDNYVYGHGILRGYETTVLLTKDGKNGVISLGNYVAKNEGNVKQARKIFFELTGIKAG